MKTLLTGGLSLLLCAAAYAGFNNVGTGVRQADVEMLARLYASASPHALITPVKVDSAVGTFAPRAARASQQVPAAGADSRLSE